MHLPFLLAAGMFHFHETLLRDSHTQPEPRPPTARGCHSYRWQGEGCVLIADLAWPHGAPPTEHRTGQTKTNKTILILVCHAQRERRTSAERMDAYADLTAAHKLWATVNGSRHRLCLGLTPPHARRKRRRWSTRVMMHVPLDAGESVVGAWRLVNRRFCLRACRCLAEAERAIFFAN